MFLLVNFNNILFSCFDSHFSKNYSNLGQLKYYFAVDTSYVAKKIGVLLFPFTRSDWAIKYNQDEPVQPKYDVNAPDLYIPTMAYATYVLLVGYILGLRNAFSPDSLGMTSNKISIVAIFVHKHLKQTFHP